MPEDNAWAHILAGLVSGFNKGLSEREERRLAEKKLELEAEEQKLRRVDQAQYRQALMSQKGAELSKEDAYKQAKLDLEREQEANRNKRFKIEEGTKRIKSEADEIKAKEDDLRLQQKEYVSIQEKLAKAKEDLNFLARKATDNPEKYGADYEASQKLAEELQGQADTGRERIEELESSLKRRGSGKAAPKTPAPSASFLDAAKTVQDLDALMAQKYPKGGLPADVKNAYIEKLKRLGGQ